MKKYWWKELVAYQIYPKSFMDSNGDGVGDINGIISKLDYLKDLGIGLIWICPFYKSPNYDNGYDISDYEDISADYGTMEDFDKLLDEIHKRDMKLIIDLVINHTSDEHPWFIESKGSKDNEKANWYIWKEGSNGVEPNNWESIFKGTVWEYSKERGEYFMHLFTKNQPDLNWENEDVRMELYKMVNWWMDKGIDGFRVDAISHIKKEEGLKDIENPKGLKYVSALDKCRNVEGIQKYLKELKEKTFDKYDVVTVAEANGVNSNNAEEWVGEEKGNFNMLFQFEYLNIWEKDKKKGFNVKVFKDILNKWQSDLEGKGWNALYIENHDIPRSVSDFGNDKEYLNESAKAFATAYFLQKGTPFIYQGQEIGMTNINFKSIDEYSDVKSINLYNECIEKGFSHEEAMKEVYLISRDNARTPMQWSRERNAGFTEGIPWIRVNPNYEKINVFDEEEEENSILNFYKELIKTRNGNNTFIYGKYKPILEKDNNIFAYERYLANERYVVISNLTENKCSYVNNNYSLKYENLILKNYPVNNHEPFNNFDLRPYECRVYKI